MTATPARALLDPSIYHLSEDESAFFKSQTGIQDDAELRKHILDVQAEAYAIFPYPCIRRFGFVSSKISKYPMYEAILKLGKERSNALFLDLGCGVGNDARKLIADGFPHKNVLTSDLRPEFWDLGHKLYKTSQETYPVRFLSGDIFDPSFLSPVDISSSESLPTGLPPPLATVTSLSPLRHHISIIHAAAFFHLFSESRQRELTQLLAALLSPFPGSMIVGSQLCLPDTTENKSGGFISVFAPRGPRLDTQDSGNIDTQGTGLAKRTGMFAHSATSWKELWAGENGIFKPDDVALFTYTQELRRETIIRAGGDPAQKAYRLVWSITKV